MKYWKDCSKQEKADVNNIKKQYQQAKACYVRAREEYYNALDIAFAEVDKAKEQIEKSQIKDMRLYKKTVDDLIQKLDSEEFQAKRNLCKETRKKYLNTVDELMMMLDICENKYRA